MKEYKTAKVWRILSYVLIPILFFPSVFLLVMPFVPDIKNDMDSNVYIWLIVPLDVGMIITLTIAFYNTIKAKFVIDKDKVFTVALLYNRTLFFNEIKGYRKTEHFTFLESNNGKKSIKLSGYLEKRDEIETWIITNFPNLELVEKNEETQEILRNQEFGWSVKQREEKLKQARKTTKILNWSGGILALASMLIINHYKYAILVCVIFPLICLAVIKHYKGLIRIDERKDSSYPSVFWTIFASTAVLVLRSLLFYKIFDYSNAWLPAISIAVGYLAILMLNNKGYVFYKAEKISSMIMMFIFIIFGYAYGSVIILNCVLDNSNAEIYKTTVINKRISSGKRTSYYLKLAPWASLSESKEVQVTNKVYDEVEPNDAVSVEMMEGKLNIPWFEVIP